MANLLIPPSSNPDAVLCSENATHADIARQKRRKFAKTTNTDQLIAAQLSGSKSNVAVSRNAN
jgi:hypothetical protein